MHLMFRKLVLSLAAAAGMVAQLVLPAEAAIGVGAFAAPEAMVQSSPVEEAQFVWGGRNYCWYNSAWRGPGWYWCGYAWRRGFGWGGPRGWHGWHVGPGRGGPGPGIGRPGGGPGAGPGHPGGGPNRPGRGPAA